MEERSITGPCTLSLSISRLSALNPIRRPRKHGQNRPIRVGPHRQLPAISLSFLHIPPIFTTIQLRLSHSAGCLSVPSPFSFRFPFRYRLLWASLLPSVGPEPKSHIIPVNDRASSRAYYSCIIVLLHPFRHIHQEYTSDISTLSTACVGGKKRIIPASCDFLRT